MRSTLFLASFVVLLVGCKKQSTEPEEHMVIWQKSGLDSMAVECFLVSGPNLFAGASREDATLSNGVFLSTNSGISWTAINDGLPSDFAVTSLAASGTDLFAGTWGGGIFLSTNNGTTWARTSLTPDYFNCLAVHGGHLLAGSGNFVFLSTDKGATWTEVLFGGYQWFLSVAAIDNNIFLGTSVGEGPIWIDPSLFLSTDNGSSWVAVNDRLGYVNVWSLVVSGGNLFAATDSGVVLFTGNGTTEKKMNNGLTHLDVRSLAVAGGNLFAGTYGGGVFLSTNNGTSWAEVNNGLTNPTITRLAVSGIYIFAGTSDGGVFRGTMQ